jgi:hypothetical protein
MRQSLELGMVEMEAEDAAPRPLTCSQGTSHAIGMHWWSQKGTGHACSVDTGLL